jgi:hypothetical protein
MGELLEAGLQGIECPEHLHQAVVVLQRQPRIAQIVAQGTDSGDKRTTDAAELIESRRERCCRVVTAAEVGDLDTPRGRQLVRFSWGKCRRG